MSTDVLAVVGSDVPTRQQLAVAVLGRRQAWWLMRSPALVSYAVYGAVIMIVGTVEATAGDAPSPWGRAALAEWTAIYSPFLLGPLTFVAAHLVASSARRSGADLLLAATPVDRRCRDLGLCLGVLAGPAMVALAIAGVSARLAGDGHPGPIDGGAVGPWLWIDVAQVPAIVLGAGILGIVVARWLTFAGSLFLGFVGMVVVTVWLLAPGATALRGWFAPYVTVTWWNDGDWKLWGSQAWHLAYLLGLSGLGVCALALRQPERRGRWLIAGAVAAAIVVTTGLLQLP